MNFWTNLFSPKPHNDANAFNSHERIIFAEQPELIYAIGDVHGEIDLLWQIEDMIYADCKELDGKKLVVYVGDLIDRGPRSADVLEHFMSPALHGIRRISLLGNHEVFFLRAICGDIPVKQWMSFGGLETLQSYAANSLLNEQNFEAMHESELLRFIEAYVPKSHIDFMASMPLSLMMPDYFFSHAGARLDVALDEQDPMDLVMIREEFIGQNHIFDKMLVHGHTITKKAIINNNTINLDTGAYATQKLTAVKIQKNAAPVFFDTQTRYLT